jgi:phosphopantothenoylcysteine decarboxylase/phosphopantothenate--cysteine ligase
MPEMPKRKLADRILDEIVSLRRPRPLVFEVDEGSSPQDKVLSESVIPASSRRRIIGE